MNFLGLVALCLITIFSSLSSPAFFGLALQFGMIINGRHVVPPLGVFFITGCNADLLVNIFLTCLGYVPLFVTPSGSVIQIPQILDD